MQIVKPTIIVDEEKGWDRRYAVWYVEKLPIHLLGYGSNRPLWRESLAFERPWRSALYEDMRDRGQINPCLVWNHFNGAEFPGPAGQWEFYVKVGRNKCWCARQLGWTHIKALVTGTPDATPIRDAVPVQPADVTRYFHDGHLTFANRGLVSKACTDAAKLQMPALPDREHDETEA